MNYGHPVATNGQHLNGEYAVGFEVLKTSQANTVETVERVLAKVEEMRLDPGLEGIDLLVWRNAGEQITKSLSWATERWRIRCHPGSAGAVFIPAPVGSYSDRRSVHSVLTHLGGGLSLPVGQYPECTDHDGTDARHRDAGRQCGRGAESIYQKLENGMDHLEASRIAAAR